MHIVMLMLALTSVKGLGRASRKVAASRRNGMRSLPSNVKRQSQKRSVASHEGDQIATHAASSWEPGPLR